MQKYYNVFVRTWWEWDYTSAGPRIKVPDPGKKRYIARHVTEDDARELSR